MLKLGGFQRILAILAIIVALAIIDLYIPLLVGRTLLSGTFAIVIVLLIWAAHWGFFKLPKLPRAPGLRPKLKAETERTVEKPQPSAEQGQAPKKDEE